MFSPVITLAQGQQAEFALPLAQGTLSAVTLTLMQGSTTVLASTAGTLQSPGDGVNKTYLWDTTTLALGSYTYSFGWLLSGVAQTALTGILNVVATTVVNYNAFPTAQDVLARLSAAGIILRDGALAARMPTVIQDVVDEVTRRTLRQFVADTSDTTRTYDGSGSSEQEVDEMVSLTSVTVLGMQSNPGYPLSNPQFIVEQNKPRTRIVIGVGSVPAWTSEGVWMPFRSIFPAGRQNILITGRFGFAPTIPGDLWAGICGEMAHRLAKEAIFNADGRVTNWKGGDESFALAINDPDALGWHTTFEDRVNFYKRPSGRRLRRLRPGMV